METKEDGVRVAEAIGREHSAGAGVQRFGAGSVPVFGAGDAHVVKLFPPEQRSFYDTERVTLAFLDGRLPFRTPRLIEAGERDGWLYVVMTRVPGSPLAEVWDSIESQNRVRLMHEAGEALSALHVTATDGLPLQPPDWPAFMEAQRLSASDRQRTRGLAEPWVSAIGGFLERWAPRGDVAPALLHTEIMRDHMLAERHDGTWRFSGLIDFEDVLLGAPEYEFASAGIFLSCADPELLRVLLDAYGVRVDDELPLRLMAYALLHRYSNLKWYLERLPFAGRAGDLEALARAWFTA